MPARIIDLNLTASHPAFPLDEAERLTFWPGGLNVTPTAIGRVAFADVVGFAVFELPSEGVPRWMLFLKNRPRAFCVRLEKVDLETVKGLEGRPAVEKLRAVARLMAQRGPDVAVDRSTAGFLKGQPPPSFPHEARVLAAAFFAQLRAQAPPVSAPPVPRIAPPIPTSVSRPAGIASAAAPRPSAPMPSSPGVPPRPPALAPPRPQAPPVSRPRAAALPPTSGPQPPPARRLKQSAPPPPPAKKSPWKWILGGLAGATVLLVALGVLLLFYVSKTMRQRTPAAPPVQVLQYGLSIADTPEVLDIRHSSYSDVDTVLNKVFSSFLVPGPGAQHIVLQDKKALVVEDKATLQMIRKEIVTREADFWIYYRADNERLSMRIDFVAERALSEYDQERISEAIRWGTWEGQVPLRPAARDPYTVAADIRSHGLVGIAEVFRDGVSKARFSWGASSPEAAKLDISNVRAVATTPEQLFQLYASLGRAFNCAVIDLYANSATIKNVRRFPGGQTREMSLTGSAFKKLVLESLQLAANRQDFDEYSNVVFTPERDGLVRIQADRYSNLKKYTSPQSMRVARQEGGYWLIVEEYAESRP